jgi:prepilin-type N-terminal cleavage/methylation domain-containing protein
MGHDSELAYSASFLEECFMRKQTVDFVLSIFEGLRRSHCGAARGFTLVELLISLAILGVIATFTIPRVIFPAQTGQNSAIAKDAAAMISGAFSAYQFNNAVSPTTTAGSITQYMNYVKTTTSGSITGMASACAATDSVCFHLHNGGILQMDENATFNADANNALNTTDAWIFNVDPDGNGTATEITFVLYSNGRLTTRGALGANASEDASMDQVVTDPSYLQNWN